MLLAEILRMSEMLMDDGQIVITKGHPGTQIACTHDRLSKQLSADYKTNLNL